MTVCELEFFTDICIASSEGTTNRKYLREEKFLDYEIYLPNKGKQKKIISNVNFNKEKISEIQNHRKKVYEENYNLLLRFYSKITENAPIKKMQEIAPITRRQVNIDLNTSYPELGIRSFGKGTFKKPTMKGADFTWQKPVWLKTGDIVFSNIKAWEGAVALIAEHEDAHIGSHRYITYVPNNDIIKTNFLYYYFFSPIGIQKLNEASPGSADRNRTLGLKKLEQIEVPIPKIEHQEKFDRVFQKIQQIKKEMNELNKSYEQLIPAIIEHNLKPQ